MKITNYEDSGLFELDQFLKEHYFEVASGLNKETLKDLLRPYNVSFVIEQCNRFQSTLLCELKESYVQQSQRYVDASNAGFDIPDALAEDDKTRYVSLVNELFSFYEKVSELGVEKIKGRPKISDYKYGIPIEDARYILPLSAHTNISIAMNASELYDMFELLNNRAYKASLKEIKYQLTELLPTNIARLLSAIEPDYDSRKLSDTFYAPMFKKIDEDNRVVFLNGYKSPTIRVGLGALTSTQQKTTSELVESYGDELEAKSAGVVSRVLGYGHTGIMEQSRSTFGVMMSLSAYHQQIRHRLPENRREKFTDIIKDMDRRPCIPNTIENSIFKDEFLRLARDVKDLRLMIYSKYGLDMASLLLLNCDMIKQITSTNARIDCEVMVERLCNTAQWEIREMYEKKFQMLEPTSKTIYVHAIPPCVFGQCKEGKLTCGKAAEVKEKYKNLFD